MALIDKLKAIADGFRASRGTTKEYSLDEMAVLAAEKVGGGGSLPENARLYYVGYANSELNLSTLNFESSAVGELKER